MPDIWIDKRYARLKKYSATVTGPKAVIKVEIETTDASALGSLLRNLGEIEVEQKARAPKPSTKKVPLGLPAPPLQIPFFDRGDE